MSSSSSKVSLITCQNPFCNRFNQKPFSNQTAYTNHIDKSPGCFNFLVRQAQVAAPHGASVVRRRCPHEDGNVAWTSNKRPALLRRHVVNDIGAAGDVPVFHLEQYPNVNFVGSEAVQEFGINSGGSDETLIIDPGYDESSVLLDDNDDEDNYCLPNALVNHEYDAEAPSFPSNFIYTTDQKWTVSLLKILDKANAPDYVFGDILEWGRSASAQNYSFNPVGGLSRSKNVDSLVNSVQNGNKLLPFVRRVMVPHGPPSDVICFDFVPQLLSLLQNPTIMTAENLAIDIDNPLKPYASQGNILSEALSGSVYHKAYNRLITNPSTQLFVPIIQWIDRTHVTGNARFSLKPYMFTPAIFTEKFRRSIKAWGYHGFMPKRKSSSAQNQVQRQGDPIRNYHAELGGALESFRECGPRLCGVVLPIGPSRRLQVDIVTCLLFVIQDMQEGDMLCGRFGTHTSGVQRHCRSCDVQYDHLDDCEIRCKFVQASDMTQIAERSDVATRTQWSQHQLENAFNRIVFADPVRGIFGATPVETMHAFRKGVVENVTKLVLSNVPASKKAAFDDLAIAFHKSHRQTFRKAYPKTSWSNGVTNLTNITANERLGLVFLFVILFQYDEGWRIIQSCLDKRTNTKVPEVLEVFESLLCFDAWLNKTHYWDTSNPEHVAQETSSTQASIRKFMMMCKDSIPIDKDNAWKYPKFHELLHIVDDMSRFGSPLNFCAQGPESLLKDAAKRPGRRAQKRHEGSAYELQSAQRLMYSVVIDTVHTRIWDTEDRENSSTEDSDDELDSTHNHNAIYQGTTKATNGYIRRVKSGKQVQYKITWDTRTHGDFMKLPPDLVKFVCDSFKEGETIHFCTEYQRDVHKFRCHPSFQSDGGIHDWMNIDFGREHGHFPCRLALVVVVDSPMEPDEKYQLVVQSTTKETHKHESTLLREWEWSPDYHLVSGNTVVGPCFVISISHNSSKVLEAKPREEWADKFT